MVTQWPLGDDAPKRAEKPGQNRGFDGLKPGRLGAVFYVFR
jgi:hypothetical protein